jgi:hypothetical protein
MARSLIQRRQEAERARVEAFEASLRRVSQRARPAPDFQQAIDAVKRGFETEIVRDPYAWRPQMKTRDAARLRVAAARYLFARYPVAEHLEQIWIDCTDLAREEIALRKRWYVVAAGGGSVYRAGADAWLSRKEVHAFLNPPGRLGFAQAIWHAIARSYANDPGIALRIASSRIAQWPRQDVVFWREVVRFFCANPTSVEEMEDLSDFLAHCHERDRRYSLKGRTLASLTRQMHAWHHDLRTVQRIEAARRRAAEAGVRARGETLAPEPSAGGSWPGAMIADWSWTTPSKDRSKREEFVLTQLRTAAELVSETRAMHHCVASYAAKCIAGQASIWSLRERVGGETRRVLTIELNRQHRAVQVRGLANRSARPHEMKILERWAKARGIALV